MSRFRLFGYGTALLLAACQTEPVSAPADSDLPSGLTFAIVDGSHGGGNPDFFFNPPIVPVVVPGTGTFNPNLSPTVKACLLPAGACEVFPNVKVTGGSYHQNWKIPRTPAGATYRVSVEVEGVVLGFADVKTSKGSDPEFVYQNAGATLPVKFRIYSHCTTEPCGEGFVDLNTGGTVALVEEGTGDPVGGIDIPPQNGVGAAPQAAPSAGLPAAVTQPAVTVTIQPCTEDLPITTFGDCITITTSLGETQFTNEALVFICSALDATQSLTQAEKEGIALHRRHNGQLEVLANDADPCATLGAAPSVGGLLRALVHGQWKRAGRQLAGLVGPKPLYAIHLGAGGRTPGTSDFQFGTGLQDGAETDQGWATTGFWHRSTLRDGSNNPFINSAFTDGLVNLASGDGSAGALPAPLAGSYAFWYGEDAPKGNYIGTRANSTPGSGGISTTANSGTLTSRDLIVPASGVLTFDTWFEIESVNPSSFDIMSVSVIPIDPAGPMVELGVLNPGTDPSGSAVTPFTSGGFNFAPGWNDNCHDLSDFAGATVQLQFEFNTVDQLYNGFRGWLVDNVLVGSGSCESELRGAALRVGRGSAGRALNPRQPPKARDQ